MTCVGMICGNLFIFTASLLHIPITNNLTALSPSRCQEPRAFFGLSLPVPHLHQGDGHGRSHEALRNRMLVVDLLKHNTADGSQLCPPVVLDTMEYLILLLVAVIAYVAYEAF